MAAGETRLRQAVTAAAGLAGADHSQPGDADHRSAQIAAGHQMRDVARDVLMVVDPMAGSGTTIDVCKTFSRKIKAFDLNPTRKDIIENDSRNVPLRAGVVDLVFLHPPYLDMVKYSKKMLAQGWESYDEYGFLAKEIPGTG